MSRWLVERSCALPPATALPRVTQWFSSNGYEAVAKSSTEVSLFYRQGAAQSAELHRVQHRLSVRSDGRRLSFEFATTVRAVLAPSPDDQRELERRVDASLSGLVSGPSTAKAARCPACSTLTPAGATECPVCGSSL